MLNWMIFKWCHYCWGAPELIIHVMSFLSPLDATVSQTAEKATEYLEPLISLHSPSYTTSQGVLRCPHEGSICNFQGPYVHSVKWRKKMAPDSLLIHCPSLLHVIVHSLIAESCFPRASFQHRPRGLCAISLYPSLCLHGDLSPRIRPLWQQLSTRQLRVTPMMRRDSKCIFSSSAR